MGEGNLFGIRCRVGDVRDSYFELIDQGFFPSFEVLISTSLQVDWPI